MSCKDCGLCKCGSKFSREELPPLEYPRQPSVKVERQPPQWVEAVLLVAAGGVFAALLLNQGV